MSVEPNIPPPPPPASPALAQRCSLCDTELGQGAQRCGSCGLFQQLGPNRPDPFRQKALWLLLGVMLAVYLIVLAIVAVIPAHPVTK